MAAQTLADRRCHLAPALSSTSWAQTSSRALRLQQAGQRRWPSAHLGLCAGRCSLAALSRGCHSQATLELCQAHFSLLSLAPSAVQLSRCKGFRLGDCSLPLVEPSLTLSDAALSREYRTLIVGYTLLSGGEPSCALAQALLRRSQGLLPLFDEVAGLCMLLEVIGRRLLALAEIRSCSLQLSALLGQLLGQDVLCLFLLRTSCLTLQERLLTLSEAHFQDIEILLALLLLSALISHAALPGNQGLLTLYDSLEMRLGLVTRISDQNVFL